MIKVTFGARVNNGRKKILIVEDDPGMQKLVSFHLKDFYDLKVVSDGWEAFTILNEGSDPQDLILTDIEMTELDGLKLIEMLDDIPEYRQIPVIVMSSTVQKNDELQLDFQNYFGCLPKPVVPAELYLKIEEAFCSRIG